MKPTKHLLATILTLTVTACALSAPMQRGSRLGSSSVASEDQKKSASGYTFSVKVDGDDLVVENVVATNFGGIDDYQDNGLTEGGVQLRKNGKSAPVDGCSLPMKGYTEQHYSGPNTSGSPIPALPYLKTKVVVTYKDKSITVPVIERGPGPNLRSHAVIDLTYKSFAQFAPVKEGMLKGVSFRILGAAKYLKTPFVPIDALKL